MSKHNYGSNIKLDVAMKGEGTGIKYEWIASACYDKPNTIFINSNRYWHQIGDKRMIRTLKYILSHEPIHNIINHDMLDKPIFGSYDRLRLKFEKLIKKQCPRTYRDWRVF